VFVDGRVVGEFKTFGEAVRHARELARERCSVPQGVSIDPVEK
jgi:hypothetical protein